MDESCKAFIKRYCIRDSHVCRTDRRDMLQRPVLRTVEASR